MRHREPRLFPALIKHWRGHRGLSQLDLALAAGVSSRHVSFVETGRAQPSREMVLRLASTLGVPLRDQNDLLRAAGFEDVFEEPGIAQTKSGPVEVAIERMMNKHEPFPMTLLDRRYDIVRTNRGADRLFARVIADPSALSAPPNIYRVLFDPRQARPFIIDWPRVARAFLSRLHRESLERPSDGDLAALVSELLTYPDVPSDWRKPDLSTPSEPSLTFRLKRDDLELAFLTTVTVFNAPQNVTLDELRIESYFPLDDATERACEESP